MKEKYNEEVRYKHIKMIKEFRSVKQVIEKDGRK